MGGIVMLNFSLFFFLPVSFFGGGAILFSSVMEM